MFWNEKTLGPLYELRFENSKIEDGLITSRLLHVLLFFLKCERLALFANLMFDGASTEGILLGSP